MGDYLTACGIILVSFCCRQRLRLIVVHVCWRSSCPLYVVAPDDA